MVKVGDRIQLNNTGGYDMLNKESRGTVVAVRNSKMPSVRAIMDRYEYGAEGNHGHDIDELDTDHIFFTNEFTIITEEELKIV